MTHWNKLTKTRFTLSFSPAPSHPHVLHRPYSGTCHLWIFIRERNYWEQERLFLLSLHIWNRSSNHIKHHLWNHGTDSCLIHQRNRRTTTPRLGIRSFQNRRITLPDNTVPLAHSRSFERAIDERGRLYYNAANATIFLVIPLTAT